MHMNIACECLCCVDIACVLRVLRVCCVRAARVLRAYLLGCVLCCVCVLIMFTHVLFALLWYRTKRSYDCMINNNGEIDNGCWEWMVDIPNTNCSWW